MVEKNTISPKKNIVSQSSGKGRVQIKLFKGLNDHFRKRIAKRVSINRML